MHLKNAFKKMRFLKCETFSQGQPSFSAVA
jgi:hypothetical protein